MQAETIQLTSDLCRGPSKRVMAVFITVLLSSCASPSKEVIIRDAASDKNPKVNEANATAIQSEKGAPSRESIALEVQPVYSASVRQRSPLQKKILASAQDKLSSNDPQGAIVLAEKGLRIDRKDPQFYIILADAYARIDNKKQSSYFAQQGLRYAQKDSREYRALQRWLH